MASKDVVGDVHIAPEIARRIPDSSSHLQWVRDYQRRAHVLSSEHEEVQHQALREKGFGVVLATWADRVKGRTLRERHVVRATPDEHVLVCCYGNFQLLVHVLDDRKLCGDGSRFRKCWERKVAPREMPNLLRATKQWLAKRAARRAQAKKVA